MRPVPPVDDFQQLIAFFLLTLVVVLTIGSGPITSICCSLGCADHVRSFAYVGARAVVVDARSACDAFLLVAVARVAH